MRKIPHLRPRVIRAVTRSSQPNYFQMHVFDQERIRLEAEKGEILKRLTLIEERVQMIGKELVKLEDVLKQRRGPKNTGMY